MPQTPFDPNEDFIAGICVGATGESPSVRAVESLPLKHGALTYSIVFQEAAILGAVLTCGPAVAQGPLFGQQICLPSPYFEAGMKDPKSLPIGNQQILDYGSVNDLLSGLNLSRSPIPMEGPNWKLDSTLSGCRGNCEVKTWTFTGKW